MLKRLSYYLNEMFPITSFIGTIMTAFAFQLTYLRLFHLPAQFHIQMLLSAIVMTSVTLLVRVVSAFKDYEDDRRNFPLKPLPSGKVLPSDLKTLGGVCLIVVVVLSATSVPLFLFGLCILGYTYFSLPGIGLLNIVYVLYSMILTFPELNWSKAWVLIPVALIFTNWEISKKIRTPKGETGFTTRLAILVSLTLQLIYTLSVFNIFSELSSPLFLRIVYGVLMFIMAIPSLRFLIRLKLRVPLKTSAESQILLTIGFLTAACFL